MTGRPDPAATAGHGADETILDTSGQKCPIPVLLARRALKPVPPGGVLRVIATDPGARADFRSFCETTGDELLSVAEEGERLIFRIRKAPAV
ncbi:MAG: sulfurtransferase TusA family protein [Alphaproteobacteria bacterium]